MPSLSEVVKDPAFTGANAATRAAIFDKWAPQDPAYANANEATKTAIRQKHGLMDSAPATPTATPTAPQQNGGFEVPAWGRENPRLYGLAGAAREALGPLVEGGAMIAGGLLGAGSAGPPGAVVGAGAGYAGGRSTLRAADVALGNIAPETATQAISNVPGDMATGMAMEAGGQVLGPVIAKGAGKVLDAGKGAVIKAGKIARESLGADANAASAALATAERQGLTPAQATASINSPTWQALLQRASTRDPRFFGGGGTTPAQAGEATNALTRLAGGATQTNALGTQQTAKTMLNARMIPQRDIELAAANSSGALDPAPVVNNIKASLTSAKFAGNSDASTVMNRVIRDIEEWTTDGVIDAVALDSIRKNSVNGAIQALYPGATTKVQKEAAAKVLASVRPAIDDAIESAGGTGYRAYLDAYSKGRHAISQKELNARAMEMYQNSPAEFVALVRGNKPEVVEKIFGPGSYDIVKQMASGDRSVLRKIARTEELSAAATGQATLGRDKLREIIEDNISKFKIPWGISAKGAAINKALDVVERKLGRKTMDILTESAKNGQRMSEILKTLPAAERNKILQMMSDPAALGFGTRGAGINALIGDNNNALVDQ